MYFKEKLNEYQQYINNELKKHINYSKCPEEVLNTSIEYSLMAGGKRVRPVIILAVYEMLLKSENISYERCNPYIVSMEMIHNFSLIHDDLPGIDNDDIRHGKPTNHKAFNEATAILAGDKLLNSAYLVISKNIKERIENNLDIKEDIEALEQLSLSTNAMINGEYIDTECENKQISLEELNYIHANKTGALIKASAKIGAFLAKASEKDIENITIYAEKIGLAFQIKDDILSEIGNEKITGKPVGNDREMNKCTYVNMYGVELANDILEKITYEAIERIKVYGEKAEFLKNLAIYIKNREK